MLFASRLLRRGHLSEQALTEALLANQRPAHVDRCDRCAARAVELARWLEQVRAEAVEAADAAFPPERLAAQQAQILRRIAQAEEPPRVIEFPRTPVAMPGTLTTRRVSPGWLGVAAAAGLVVGVIGGHASARLDTAAAEGPQRTEQPAVVLDTPAVAQSGSESGASLLTFDTDSVIPASLRLLDENTPRLVQQVQYASAR